MCAVSSNSTENHSDRQTLRRLGTRAATDLEPATQPDRNGREPHPIEPDEFWEKMRTALNDEDSPLPSFTVSIWKTLAREPNLFHVRHWKEMSKYLEQTSGPAYAATEEAGVEQPLPAEAEMESLAR